MANLNELKPEDVMRALECSGYSVIGALLDVKTGKHQLITTSDVASLLKKYKSENAEKDAEIERLKHQISVYHKMIDISESKFEMLDFLTKKHEPKPSPSLRRG